MKSLVSIVLLAQALSLAGCSEQECTRASGSSECTNEVVQSPTTRSFDPSTGTLAPADHVSRAAGVRVSRLAIAAGAAQRQARYLVELPGGRRFRTTVTQRIQRDGSEESVITEEIDIGGGGGGGDIAGWTTSEDQFTVFTDSASVTATGDDYDAQQIVLSVPGAELGALSYAGVAADSQEEADRDLTVSLAMLGTVPITQDQMIALSAATLAAGEDLGAPAMGWLRDRWRAIRRVLQNTLCNPGATVFCTAALAVGLGTLPAGGIAAAFGAGCLIVQSQIC